MSPKIGGQQTPPPQGRPVISLVPINQLLQQPGAQWQYTFAQQQAPTNPTTNQGTVNQAIPLVIPSFVPPTVPIANADIVQQNTTVILHQTTETSALSVEQNIVATTTYSHNN